MRKLLTAALALITLFTAAPAFAEDPWIKAAASDSGSVFYALRSDILAGRSDQTAAGVWVKIDSSRDRTVVWMEVTTRYVVNCPMRSYRPLQTTVFFRGGRTEDLTSDNKLQYAIPGSNMDAVLDLLCTDPVDEGDTNYR